MDIGEVTKQEGEGELDAVGKGACHTCGEHGCFSRECPKKGKGGFHDKGKAKGAVFQGTCWTCGEAGCMSRFCPKSGGKKGGKDFGKGGKDLGKGGIYGKGGLNDYRGKGKGDYGKGW
jgi:hypothetical protein